jgi:Arc/MetJ-type ribon-helix-helix transcriptional regulator
LQSYCIKLQPRLVEQIDALVKDGWCASRNEFLREAAMQRLLEARRALVGQWAEELRAKATKHPKTPFLSRKEREEAARELLAEQGFQMNERGETERIKSRTQS